MKDTEVLIKAGIAAVVPVYEAGAGNVTLVITSDGKEHLIGNTTRTVIRRIARAYGVDLAAVRENYGRAVNRRNYVPVPLSPSLILIPVKFRERPLGENDGTVGYLSYYEIRDIEENGSFCRVLLACGKWLRVLLGKATLLEYMKDARLIAGIYEEKHRVAAKAEQVREPEPACLQESGKLREELINLLVRLLSKSGG
ncbi:hypothetical protein [Thermosediminibacter oceani]|uniref:ComK family protein n=1 Tax=Thermosediminibacter oceani (strain ATCC BAA-1034 / DSM 16646 / JW/IW-1228P) TaxID=555079 RepID=D9S1H4_THEOJ|nr:hypothetical protein [Thermosediminibacter oceani]ADL07251.1 hypothetical protein Toce_0474 [Thermosediminibacter oceani DSM 16646]